ncbi:hypothetical protein P3X46_025739 [Hevea brasiliensis]|uniref:Protein kinase domain-containing protein n=1 Tax=Hevea brasiliensis TaxID=3981 RepID=A0ABQ9L7K1_HEVBR|nr:putative serine/threonine-protein kinase-like protein CCR3 [Hevea brasiliensis]KAJ9160328.1 hypothetical protein P3X46_025739 [Hevea brasiliensis]
MFIFLTVVIVICSIFFHFPFLTKAGGINKIWFWVLILLEIDNPERRTMAESLHIDVKQDDDNGSEKADRFAQKVSSLERIFLIANFILELPSAAFDQLSSVHKPQYALLSMLISFTVLIISIIDLVYKGRKERVTWMIRGLIPWFYYPYPNSKPFGTFPDIIGLVCAVFQFIFAAISYAFLSQHSDNPIKVSVWPVFFAFGLLSSRLSGNTTQRPTPHLRRVYRVEEFSLAQLAAATNDFSIENTIGIAHPYALYIGKLPDGSEVAVSRRDTGHQKKKFQEEDSYFENELTFLSRLHHKHLIRLVGYCEEDNERILVYEYVKNGSLHDLLHKNNVDKKSSVINSWKMRIKIALDAARGIEYLHNYAVPPIIHGDIKSFNILLDVNWAARVCDFGMSMLDAESESNYKPKKAMGTDGYIDPEFYSRNVLTAKSDVYSLGVVLLELLTGKRAVFKDEDNGGATSLVDFAVPKILANELVKVLDNRIGPPKLVKEAEAVELVAYTALHCVNLEGNNRPSITNIVANLEQASSLCDVRNEGLPIGAEELHGRSNEEVANSNGTEKHHSEVLERQQ